MRGLDNIPDEKATILVLYHAQIPIDAPYVLSKILLEKKRKPITIVDRLVYNIPGYRTFLEAFEQQSGTVEGCLEYMKNNEMLAIYPGGTREGCLAGDNYEIIWPERAGFAKIAHQTKPVIIPIFTQNCRNVFAVIHLLKACCRRLYLRKKFSYTPLCGWFPVKLM
jgi:1-acyl-sn-glycerol-3-phosphate acyltransferase